MFWKKDEIKKPKLNNETDAVITSPELPTIIQEVGFDFENFEETELDTIYSECTVFMKSAVISSYKFITGKDRVPLKLKAVRGSDNLIKIASIDIYRKTVNLAVIYGMIKAMDLIPKIENKEKGFENIYFIEVMVCPEDCVIEGGTPRARINEDIMKRLNSTYYKDVKANKRVAQNNEQLNLLYNESFVGI